jgi:riboflavin kinase/FMN adenylyltransferase
MFPWGVLGNAVSSATLFVNWHTAETTTPNAPGILVDESAVLPESARGCVLSIGKFDGVHRGHQALARSARSMANRLGVRCLAVTFDPAPLAVLNPSAKIGPPLTPLDRKILLLRHCGFDDVAVFRTGAWLLDLEAREFFDRIIRERFRAAGLAEGPDFTFGKNRSGSGRQLANWCLAHDLEYEEVPPVEIDGLAVTSSQIRLGLAAGRVDEATAQLGHALVTRGLIVRGAGRGRSIETPTANLSDCDTIVPGPGVYAAGARVIDGPSGCGHWLAAAVNVGTQPTFASDVPRVEVHLIGQPDRDLYGATAEVAWLRQLRPTKRFESINALKAQIAEDLRASMHVYAAEFAMKMRFS